MVIQKKLFKEDAVSYKHFHIRRTTIEIPVVFSLIFKSKYKNLKKKLQLLLHDFIKYLIRSISKME